ncbi:MAG TPA: methyltransferase domain-containing protein [Thermoanaerobaculia bacterium]|nr:methyltransferase domain-containing protein [Thermoanaerobaculia bacterium]
MDFLRALIVLHRAFRRSRISTRVHALIRFLTCPFLRVLRFMPRDTRTMLEIGAGHGVFSRLAAARGVARIVAVEPDLSKVANTNRDSIAFVAGFDDVVRGTFDCIAIMDVLYAIPIAQWDGILARAAGRLRDGGVLLIKEQDPRARIKNAWNRAQEWLSMTLLRITYAETFNYEDPDAFVARLGRHGFKVDVRRVDFLYPHPHIAYIATRITANTCTGDD